MLAGVASMAAATAIPERTVRASVTSAGAAPDGASRRPSITAGGTVVAFDSEARNLDGDRNGAVRDVFHRDLASGRTTLMSVGLDGAPADGPSEAPVLAGRAASIVFSSLATNLVAGDTNRARDVFVRAGSGPIRRVSVTSANGEPNGPSFEADISRDGRRVVFTSTASNLVPNDHNGVEDVFVRDLAAGTTRRVSERFGIGAEGRSRAPSISPDGRWVSFESTARDLINEDDNEVSDVFLADLTRRSIRRVSVNSRGEGQNRAVVAPFVTVSDVSADGRFVTWDSDATNLVPGDRNGDTDVFVRDLRRGRTLLVSRSSTGAQGDNDAYFPRLSDDGRYIAFSSFARNLWPSDRGGEDVFVHDRTLRATSLLTVTNAGRRRGPEAERQLLRRASFSEGARRIAFTSTASLTAGDTDKLEDVLVRSTDAPDGRIVSGPSGTIRDRTPGYRLAADDPAAVFLCRIDARAPFFCPRSGTLPRLSPGSHRLLVRAGGPGMLVEAKASLRTFRVR
jgi:hypothetical protein